MLYDICVEIDIPDDEPEFRTEYHKYFDQLEALAYGLVHELQDGEERLPPDLLCLVHVSLQRPMDTPPKAVLRRPANIR